MRHLILTGLFIATVLGLQAQAEFEIFSEMGEEFTVYLNQSAQNSAPAARVSVADIESGFYHLRVDFEDASLADFAKNNVGIERGKRSVYMIKMDRKGNYVARFHSFVELQGATATAATQPTAPPATSSPTINTSTDVSMNSTGASTTESVNMKVSVGNAFNAMGAAAKSLGASIGDAAANMSMDVTVTETTTTTTSGNWGAETSAAVEPRPASPTNDIRPMSAFDFDDYLKAIQEKTFEDSKLTTAKAPLRSQYLTAEQIAQVMRAFTFEDTRIEFAIFAHNRCVDPGNYYKTHGALEYELSIEEIEEAIGQ
jgi:hypothetical protein